MAPHPFRTLDVAETKIARDVILSLHVDTVVDFREIYLQEPEKEAMKRYLEVEHSSEAQGPPPTRPPRLAKCQYDVIGADKIPEYHEAVVNVETKERVKHEVIGKEVQATLTMWEFEILIGMSFCSQCSISLTSSAEACKQSELFQTALAEFKLPEGFELVIEPWYVT
jgi:primary-amine oxidase